VRRRLIQLVLPLVFCVLPPLGAGLIALALPVDARKFYQAHMSPLDWLILSLGGFLFVVQMLLAWRALRWRGSGFDERPDRWLTNLAQAAEWFPMLGLIGTVAGIMQTFGAPLPPGGKHDPSEIIRNYAPALTATGSGLLMALVNLLPTWVVLLGRDLIRTLGGGDTLDAGRKTRESTLPPVATARSAPDVARR
jgi:hypothetical protein